MTWTQQENDIFNLIYSQILKVHMLLYTNKHVTETIMRILLFMLEINLYISQDTGSEALADAPNNNNLNKR